MKCKLTEIFQNLSTEGAGNYYFKENVIRPQYKKLQENLDTFRLFQIIRKSLTEERNKIEEMRRASGHVSVSVIPMDTNREETTYEQIRKEIEAEIKRSDNIYKRLINLNKSYGPSSTLDPVQIAHCIQAIDEEIGGCVSGLIGVKNRIISELEKLKDKQRICPIAFKAEVNQITEESRAHSMANFKGWFNFIHQIMLKLKEGFQYFHLLCRKINSIPQQWPWPNQIDILQQEMILASKAFGRQPYQIIRTDTGAGDLILHFFYPMSVISVELIVVNKEGATKVQTAPSDQKNRPEFLDGLSVAKLSIKRKTKYENTFHYHKVTVSQANASEKIKTRVRGSGVQNLFWIYVRSTVEYYSVSLRRNVSTVLHALSLPVAIITYSSYMDQCWPQLVWLNACPTTSQNCYNLEGSDRVLWQSLIEIIDQEFRQTGKSLTEEQKEYLKEKLGTVNHGDLVSKELFLSKRFPIIRQEQESSESSEAGSSTSIVADSEPEAISFAEYLFYCLKLLNSKAGKELREMWKDGKIIGFLSNEQIENKLSTCPAGTLAICFPGKLPMHIGLYFYKATDNQEKLAKLCYDTNDLKIASLEKRILANKSATYLYSNYKVEECGPVIKKEFAFPQVTTSGTFNVEKNNYILRIQTVFTEVLPRWFSQIGKST